MSCDKPTLKKDLKVVTFCNLNEINDLCELFKGGGSCAEESFMWIRSFFILLFLFISYFPAYGEESKKIFHQNNKFEKIPRKKILNAVASFKKKFEEVPQVNQVWSQGNFWYLFNRTIQRMVASEKIFNLTPEIRVSFNLDKAYCFEKRNPKKHSECTKMDAFYIPEADIIFIDNSIPDEKFPFLLFHEFIHVYQNDFRLPLDLLNLQEMLDSNNLSTYQDETLDLINFYYEAQAHWYTLTLAETETWYEYAKSSNIFSAGSKIGLGIVTNLFTLGNVNTLKTGTKEINEFLPKKIMEALNVGHFSFKGKSAFGIPEMIVYNYDGFRNLATNFDFNTHRHYAERLEETQFGKLDFLVSGEGRDRETQFIFKNLTDVYYDLLIDQPIGKIESCERLFNYIQNNQAAPIIQWQSLNYSEFEECEIYRTVSDDVVRKNMIDIYRGIEKPSPYRARGIQSSTGGQGSDPGTEIKPGGQGSDPGTEIKPGGQGSDPGTEIKPGGQGSDPGAIIFPQVDVVP